jgi:hypothetical protein
MNRDGAELGREAGSLRLYADVRDSGAPQKPPRDWKRAILIFGLGALSWVATYVGMLELIEANMGDLPIVHRVIVGFSVAMLMTMIIWLLDQLFRPHAFFTKLFYAGGYIFLSLISIGFGFGFYWKVLESRGEASRSAESAVSEVQNALHGAETRLEQLQATLTQLTQVSTEKAQLEQTKGTSCPNSKPGDGPRRKMREDDAQRFSFASDFVKGRIGAVKADMQGLNGDLTKIVSADASTFDPKTGTRNEFMRALGRKLDLTATGFNAFRTDPQLRQIRTDLADRAERTTFGDGKNGTVSCPDPQLQMALRGVVKAIDQLPEMQKPQIATVEGPEATIEAFRRLTTTFYGLLAFKMPPSADELRELQKKAIQSVESPAEVRASGGNEASGLSKRDYVPLAVALFVDLCLFLVSMGQRPGGRLDGLVPKMKAAERGPVIEILSRFNEIHRDKQIRENFELFRHVVFDMNGDYYVAVPLDAPPRMNPAQREILRVEAQLLSNLFASFEREKIFKRTLLPTTGSVQKRLARQGSKFAGSESFRVYKFTNGAWSDIILGAVMGAARRAERNEFGGRSVDHDTETATPGPQAPGPEPTSAARSTRPIAEDVDGDSEPAAPPRFAEPVRAVRPNMAIDPDHAARFGPYAQAYRPEPELTPPQAPRVKRPAPKPDPEADVTVTAANTNIAELAGAPTPEARPATVVTVPRVTLQTEPIQSAPAHASVVLQRETATFSVPVSEAVMPPSLKSAMRAFEGRWPADPDGHSVALPANPLSPSAISSEARERVIPKDDQLSDHERAFIRRIAPPAAE